MKLSPPKVLTWWICVLVGGLGVLATLVKIPTISGFAPWLVIIGFVLLVIATLVKGL